MYGDDTVLYLAGPTVDNLTFYINQDLQCLSEWLEDNNLVVNVSKTKCVLFTSRRQKERYCILNLNLLGKSISCETTFQYQDVVFDNFMTWKAHADYVCKKVASREKRSAAEQDISFYLNFDILSTILGLNCVLAF